MQTNEYLRYLSRRGIASMLLVRMKVHTYKAEQLKPAAPKKKQAPPPAPAATLQPCSRLQKRSERPTLEPFFCPQPALLYLRSARPLGDRAIFCISAIASARAPTLPSLCAALSRLGCLPADEAIDARPPRVESPRTPRKGSLRAAWATSALPVAAVVLPRQAPRLAAALPHPPRQR